MARAEEADGLYGLPLGEFVATRTALAKRLRAEGRADDAAEVAGLRKPSLALWAVNQLSRRLPEEVAALLEAAARVRRGEDALADLRRAETGLVGSAGRLLEEAGHAASDETLGRVATTLRAAAASEGEEREAFERGALERELEPSGFEAMAGVASPARKPKAAKPSGDARAASRRARAKAAEAALAEARARARELGREADEAERAAEGARRAAERAEAALRRAEEALERARR